MSQGNWMVRRLEFAVDVMPLLGQPCLVCSKWWTPCSTGIRDTRFNPEDHSLGYSGCVQHGKPQSPYPAVSRQSHHPCPGEDPP